MAKIYTKTWQNGKSTTLGSGYHYKQGTVACLIVPAGQVVRLYENMDRTGRKSKPLYEGHYDSLAFHGFDTKKIGCIHVEKTALTARDMMTIVSVADYGGGASKGGGRYYRRWKLPIGDRVAGIDFANDSLDYLEIPFGLTVEVFDKQNFSGGSLIFSGNREGKSDKIALSDYNYRNKISSMKIRSDEWEQAGIAVDQDTIQMSENSQITGAFELANNRPQEEGKDNSASISTEISADITDSTGEDWSVGGSVAARAGFEAEAMGIKVTGEVEVTVEGGYGQNKSRSTSKALSGSVEANVPAGQTVQGSVIADIGQMEFEAVRKWRNKRNGAIISERGKISKSWGIRVRGEVH